MTRQTHELTIGTKRDAERASGLPGKIDRCETCGEPLASDYFEIDCPACTEYFATLHEQVG